jgi:hypothetical protein
MIHSSLNTTCEVIHDDRERDSERAGGGRVGDGSDVTVILGDKHTWFTPAAFIASAASSTSHRSFQLARGSDNATFDAFHCVLDGVVWVSDLARVSVTATASAPPVDAGGTLRMRVRG